MVVGTGITALVAAYELKRPGVNVPLFEAGEHAGGQDEVVEANQEANRRYLIRENARIPFALPHSGY